MLVTGWRLEDNDLEKQGWLALWKFGALRKAEPLEGPRCGNASLSETMGFTGEDLQTQSGEGRLG